jgi:hypothetical protein
MPFLLSVAATQTSESYGPQPENELGQLLSITWSRGPDLPQGLQDSNGGIIDHMLVTACGFCAGRDNDRKPGKYPRGFLKKVWALDLTDETKGWAELPEFPGAARQGLLAATVGDAIYFWGGFSYSEPYTHKDGYRLSRIAVEQPPSAVDARSGVPDRQQPRAAVPQSFAWNPLPPLPWPICGSMCCVIGPKIYVFGGADYNAEAFFTKSDRRGELPRLGARLITFDTEHPEAGWRPFTECPGTPRWVAAMAAVKGKIYVLGGATGDPYCTVVDNWLYDPARDAWSRLRDLPVASGNFPAGSIVFQDRYILLGGGYQYPKVAGSDGATREPYGTPHRFQDKGDYFNDVFVYDTKIGLFGRADSMPLNNNLSMMLVHGDQLFMIGGETGGAFVEGVFYGHHPELLLEGRIGIRD